MQLLLLDGSDLVKLCLSDTHYKPVISLTKGDLTISAELTDDDMESLGMGGPDVDDLEEQVEEMEKQVEKLEEVNNLLQVVISDLKDENKSLHKRIENLQNSLAAK